MDFSAGWHHPATIALLPTPPRQICAPGPAASAGPAAGLPNGPPAGPDRAGNGRMRRNKCPLVEMRIESAPPARAESFRRRYDAKRRPPARVSGNMDGLRSWASARSSRPWAAPGVRGSVANRARNRNRKSRALFSPRVKPGTAGTPDTPVGGRAAREGCGDQATP